MHPKVLGTEVGLRQRVAAACNSRAGRRAESLDSNAVRPSSSRASRRAKYCPNGGMAFAHHHGVGLPGGPRRRLQSVDFRS
jgi:hypothetical protein